MLALILLLVAAVAILNVAELAPAGTVTLTGTVAFAGLLLVRFTRTALDVTLLSVTVPTAVEPPTTVVGFSVRPESAAGVTGLTANVVDFVTPE